MTEPHPLLFSLQKLVIDLALIDRHHHLAGQSRRENDVEHSFSVAILCWFIQTTYDLKLDIAKILKYALAHDLVEVQAGDTNTYASAAERRRKIEREKMALDTMTLQFQEFEDLCQSMRNYEDKADDEALFVWTVDKMQAMIMGDMDGWRPYATLNITYEQFVAKHGEQLQAGSPHIKFIFDGLIAYCKTTYYDRPHQGS